MRITITGCTHIGKTLAGYDWRTDIQKTWDDVIEEANRSDLFFHLGDLFDTGRPSPRDYRLALELLWEIDCPMVIMQGNHDENPGTEPGALEPLKKVSFRHEVLIADIHSVKQFDERQFAFFPYMNDAKVKVATSGKMTSSQESLDWFMESLKRKEFESNLNGKRVRSISLLCTHIDIRGLAYLIEEDSSKRVGAAVDVEVLKRLPFDVVCGHIHKWAKVEPNVYLPGSLLPFDFSEEGVKKFCLVVNL